METSHCSTCRRWHEHPLGDGCPYTKAAIETCRTWGLPETDYLRYLPDLVHDHTRPSAGPSFCGRNEPTYQQHMSPYTDSRHGQGETHPWYLQASRLSSQAYHHQPQRQSSSWTQGENTSPEIIRHGSAASGDGQQLSINNRFNLINSNQANNQNMPFPASNVSPLAPGTSNTWPTHTGHDNASVRDMPNVGVNVLPGNIWMPSVATANSYGIHGSNTNIQHETSERQGTPTAAPGMHHTMGSVDMPPEGPHSRMGRHATLVVSPGMEQYQVQYLPQHGIYGGNQCSHIRVADMDIVQRPPGNNISVEQGETQYVQPHGNSVQSATQRDVSRSVSAGHMSRHLVGHMAVGNTGTRHNRPTHGDIQNIDISMSSANPLAYMGGEEPSIPPSQTYEPSQHTPSHWIHGTSRSTEEIPQGSANVMQLTYQSMMERNTGTSGSETMIGCYQNTGNASRVSTTTRESYLNPGKAPQHSTTTKGLYLNPGIAPQATAPTGEPYQYTGYALQDSSIPRGSYWNIENASQGSATARGPYQNTENASQLQGSATARDPYLNPGNALPSSETGNGLYRNNHYQPQHLTIRQTEMIHLQPSYVRAATGRRQHTPVDIRAKQGDVQQVQPPGILTQGIAVYTKREMPIPSRQKTEFILRHTLTSTAQTASMTSTNNQQKDTSVPSTIVSMEEGGHFTSTDTTPCSESQETDQQVPPNGDVALGAGSSPCRATFDTSMSSSAGHGGLPVIGPTAANNTLTGKIMQHRTVTPDADVPTMPVNPRMSVGIEGNFNVYPETYMSSQHELPTQNLETNRPTHRAVSTQEQAQESATSLGSRYSLHQSQNPLLIQTGNQGTFKPHSPHHRKRHLPSSNLTSTSLSG